MMRTSGAGSWPKGVALTAVSVGYWCRTLAESNCKSSKDTAIVG